MRHSFFSIWYINDKMTFFSDLNRSAVERALRRAKSMAPPMVRAGVGNRIHVAKAMVLVGSFHRFTLLQTNEGV